MEMLYCAQVLAMKEANSAVLSVRNLYSIATCALTGQEKRGRKVSGKGGEGRGERTGVVTGGAVGRLLQTGDHVAGDLGRVFAVAFKVGRSAAGLGNALGVTWVGCLQGWSAGKTTLSFTVSCR